ncbi:flagellar regulator YcgR PilZN domain-containing protein [Nitrincola sp. MINF-07-Sa-05]|uniref:flagellar regulator YcgR PilZN domain-containing protein n=1 Tax=Nitrincola salilacus TaxID=3400273 RepID=UPI00391825B3
MSEGQLITSPKEIMLMFRRIQARLSPITIRPRESGLSLTSYLLEIDAENRQLVLDEALPRNRNHLLQDGRPLILETLYDGCRLTSTEVVAKVVTSAQGELHYSIPLPKKLHYLQRRQSFRAPVRTMLDIMARLPDASYDMIHGRLKDLSVDGCRLEFNGDLSTELVPGQIPLPLTLIFPNTSQLELHLVLLRVDYNDTRQKTYCGCRFEALNGSQRARVANLVTDLQRDQINHERHGGDPTGTPVLFIPGEKSVFMETEVKSSPGPTPSSPSQAQAQSKATDNPRQLSALQLQTLDAPVDIRRAHQSAVIAMKDLVAALRVQKLLPIEQAQEAAHNLLRAWMQDRQHLILLTRMRTADNFLFEHSIAVGVLLADFVAFKQADQIRPESLERLIFSGLCHDLAKSLITEGIEDKNLIPTDDRVIELREHMDDLISQLARIPGVPKETLVITRQSLERLDGSGLPKGLMAAEMHPLGKLAAVIDTYDTLSHRWLKEDVHFHPLLAIKQMLGMPDQLHTASIRHLIAQQGRFPLGSTVRLNDQTLGLVMRQDENQQPTHLRLVYSLANTSAFPSRDIDLRDSNLSIEASSDPVKPGISSSLLRLPLRS